MAIRRFFSDLWYVISSIPNIWRLQRIMSKETLKFANTLNKIGPIGAFLQFFEEIRPEDEEIKQFILSEFLEGVLPTLDEEDIVLEDRETFYAYCRKYDISVPNQKI